jgi:predicted N-acyltransferase
MRIATIASLNEISPQEWNSLDLGGNPLVRHEFLLAMEQTGCATRESGWQAQHLLLTDADGRLRGAVPLYLKQHSWGEFVFDWSWAGAYQRLGLDYYPKLVSAVPFTPCSGARLLARGSADEQRAIRERLTDALLDRVRDHSLSSAHLLFVTEDERLLLDARGFIMRCDCQFHWRNHGFQTFEQFISTFRADKRKKALRERRRVAEAGIRFDTLRGCDMTDEQWRTAMQLSAATFRNHGHEHYLNVAFFRAVSQALPEAVMVKFAMLKDETVAAAIFFRSADTLYGRYWGAAENFHSLHFEACYYQGIDYCIEHGIQRFEPGTQGEHKIARGFAPSKTWSAHWIADPQLARAIRSHAAQERAAVDRYIEAVNEHLPFHRAETAS